MVKGAAAVGASQGEAVRRTPGLGLGSFGDVGGGGVQSGLGTVGRRGQFDDWGS